LDPYNDTIYNIDIICNTKWNNYKRILVVLVGDLVDGSRGGRGGVDDPKGAFEFLLHCFLYNIRLSAKQHESEVMFTMGNHDIRSVFITPIPYNDITSLYDYVHRTTWNFLDVSRATHKNVQREKRKKTLIEFYRNCPYGTLLMDNGIIKEVAFVHGGFHSFADIRNTSSPPSDIINQILPLQEILNNDLNIENFARNLYASNNNALETRYYAESTDPELCNKLTNFPYNKIVVGHCQTMKYTPNSTLNKIYTKLLSENPARHTKCTSGTGCVLLTCEKPQIAFTDVGISQAFFRGTTNNERAVEVLILQKNRSYRLGSNLEYYTTMVKQATQDSATDPIVPLPNTTPSYFSARYMDAFEINLNSNEPGFPETMRVKSNENSVNSELRRERILIAAQKRINASREEAAVQAAATAVNREEKRRLMYSAAMGRMNAQKAATTGSSRRRRRQRKQRRGSRKTRLTRKRRI
jgi:hypothetical protein